MLSVLIVNWNTKDLLAACLESLERNPGSEPLETIVVDNASSDGSAAMVRSKFPRVKLMDSKGRKAKIAEFWKWVLSSTRAGGIRRATNAADALAWIRSYFERARSNDFLMGRGSRAEAHSTWRCDFDFLLSDKGKKQVIEKTEAVAA